MISWGRIPGIAGAVLLAHGCGAESRGWVLWEREPTAIDACADCTYRFALDGLAATLEHGGTDGVSYVDVCPGDGVLVGYAGTLQDVPVEINGAASVITVIGSLKATCASVAISRAGDLAITPAADPLPTRGEATNPATWSLTCLPGEVIVGVGGRSGIFLDAISVVCARPSLTQSTSGPTITLSGENAVGINGGDGGNAFDDRCPTGQLARGHSLRSGIWINSFGLVCGAPSFSIAGG